MSKNAKSVVNLTAVAPVDYSNLYKSAGLALFTESERIDLAAMVALRTEAREIFDVLAPALGLKQAKERATTASANKYKIGNDLVADYRKHLIGASQSKDSTPSGKSTKETAEIELSYLQDLLHASSTERDTLKNLAGQEKEEFKSLCAATKELNIFAEKLIKARGFEEDQAAAIAKIDAMWEEVTALRVKEQELYDIAHAKFAEANEIAKRNNWKETPQKEKKSA